MKRVHLLPVLAALIILTSCGNGEQKKSGESAASTADSGQVNVRTEEVGYTLDTANFNGYVAYNESATTRRPIVLVVHEWWGINDYVRARVRQLAEMGYIAMAVDMYGGGRNAADPAAAQELANPFYNDPTLAKRRLEAALLKVKGYAQADTAQVAAIGYCFGGFVVLNAAKLGVDLDGVVSFHGGLGGAPIRKDLLKAAVLVAHGGADPFVPQPEVDAFRKGMDSIGARYSFKVYPGATHAFTNPDATETGKKFSIPIAYNGAADSASWNDMKGFLGTVFK
jgi:dienelactone hydrolase